MSTFQNTAPSSYLIDIYEKVRFSKRDDSAPSNRILRALQNENPGIRTGGFQKSVLDSVFDDAVEQHFDNKSYAARYVRRLQRWTGPSFKEHLIKRCDILNSWKYHDGCFVPDAYLIDAKNRTVVCYEVEDGRPLNHASIMKYSNAWWTLEYIYWDLHLIAYDVYGNPRIVAFPYSGFVAKIELDRRNSTKITRR